MVSHLYDSYEEYRECQSLTSNMQVKKLFETFSENRLSMIKEIEAVCKVRRLILSESGTLLAPLQIAFMGIKTLVTGADTHALIVGIKDHELELLASYEVALQYELPNEVKTLLEKQYDAIDNNISLIEKLDFD